MYAYTVGVQLCTQQSAVIFFFFTRADCGNVLCISKVITEHFYTASWTKAHLYTVQTALFMATLLTISQVSLILSLTHTLAQGSGPATFAIQCD